MENNIFYTSSADYAPLAGIKGLIKHLSYMTQPYDEGKFANKDAVLEFGPNSISLKDETFPILSVQKIINLPLFDEVQEAIMDKIYGDYISCNDNDDEFLNRRFFRIDNHEVKKQLENIFINYDKPFCRVFKIEVTHFSRDDNKNIVRSLSKGQITLFRGFDGILHHETDLDLSLLLGVE